MKKPAQPILVFLWHFFATAFIKHSGSNSNMAALPFVGTLDSDDDVEQFDDETDSEGESEKVYSNSCLLWYLF